MKARILYFASVREALGRDGETAELPGEQATAAEVLTALQRRDPAPWEKLTGTPLRFAVNCEFAPATTTLRDGDELAIFPPVTGG